MPAIFSDLYTLHFLSFSPRFFDRQAFNLCPRIPAIFLPWKLSENHFFPKHVTLVLFSVLDSCLFSPIVEESFKLFSLKLLLRKKMKKINSKKTTVLTTGNVAENVPQASNIFEEHSLKSYMVVMISISIGMKVADNIRRIVLYSHANQKHRMFFAIARSFFPGLLLYMLYSLILQSKANSALNFCILLLGVLSCTYPSSPTYFLHLS